MASPETSLYGLDQLHAATEFLSDVAGIENATLIQPMLLNPVALRRLHECGLGVATLVSESGAHEHVTYVINEDTPEMRTAAEIYEQEAEGSCPKNSSAQYIDDLVEECLGPNWLEECLEHEEMYYNFN